VRPTIEWRQTLFGSSAVVAAHAPPDTPPSPFSGVTSCSRSTPTTRPPPLHGPCGAQAPKPEPASGKLSSLTSSSGSARGAAAPGPKAKVTRQASVPTAPRGPSRSTRTGPSRARLSSALSASCTASAVASAGRRPVAVRRSRSKAVAASGTLACRRKKPPARHAPAPASARVKTRCTSRAGSAKGRKRRPVALPAESQPAPAPAPAPAAGAAA
jgi:hypothetical protein